eukprot:542664_1
MSLYGIVYRAYLCVIYGTIHVIKITDNAFPDPTHSKANEDEKTTNNKVDIKSELIADNGSTYLSELVFIEAFKYIQRESKTFLRKKKIKVKKGEIQYILTVPAIWSEKAKYMM